MWYKDWFADERYLALYGHRNEAEAEQLLDLIEREIHPIKSARILDLACGAGRHSITLAKRGYTNVTGLDLSPTLIAKARKAAEDSKASVEFIESDMRSFDGSYDIILNLFTSFGYFESDADNNDVICHIGSALSASGYFVLDYFNAQYVRNTLNPYSNRMLNNAETVEEFRVIDSGRVKKKIILQSGECTKEYNESVRLYDKVQLQEMIVNAGMTVEKCFGSYAGRDFSYDNSPRCILLSKKT